MKRRDDLGKHTIDSVIEAIEGGDKDKAIELCRQMYQESVVVHDSLIEMVELSQTYIAEKLGEESVEDVWRYLAEIVWRPTIEMFKGMDYEEVLQMIAFGNRAHGSKFYVEQDDEKTTFVITDCGSGGKLRREGKLDYLNRHPMNGGATKKPYSWSDDQTGVPYYCVHAPMFFNVLPKEWGFDYCECQYGRQFDDDGNPVDEPCRQTIYRKPRASKS